LEQSLKEQGLVNNDNVSNVKGRDDIACGNEVRICELKLR